MEVHYHDALTSSEGMTIQTPLLHSVTLFADIPNLDIVYTTKRQKFVAGIFLVGAMIRHGLPPGISSTVQNYIYVSSLIYLLIILDFTVDSECKFKGPNPMYPFAFRTHTHTHGIYSDSILLFS